MNESSCLVCTANHADGHVCAGVHAAVCRKCLSRRSSSPDYTQLEQHADLLDTEFQADTVGGDVE